MQKGFTTLPILAIIALSVSILGGGSYAVYKVNEIQRESNTAVAQLKEEIEKMASSTSEIETAPITTTSSSNEQATTSIAEPELDKIDTKEIIAPSYKAPNLTVAEQYTAPELVDICLNIEGSQAVTPTGYKVSGNTCIKMEDKCSNIAGAQEEVPEGMLLSKDYGCVTEAEMDELAAKDSYDPYAEQQEKEEQERLNSSKCQKVIGLYNDYENEHEKLEGWKDNLDDPYGEDEERYFSLSNRQGELYTENTRIISDYRIYCLGIY